MTGLLEADARVDLSDLPSLEDIVRCSSRSPHDCSVVAVFRSTSTHPCPDPVRTVFWCLARYQKHQVWTRSEVNCHWCQRDVRICWRIQTL